MKKHGNTLYITTQESWVHQDGMNLVISVERKERFRLPIHTIKSVVTFGNVTWSPFALGLCGDNGVAVSMLSMNGHFLARLSGQQSGNVLLRRAQCKATSDPVIVSKIARVFITAKIANARTVLHRALRDHPEKVNVHSMEQTIGKISISINDLKQPLSIDTIRGVEGDAAKIVFSVFDQLITSQKKEFYFKERSRRPPLDRVNALLSFIYTLLAHDLRAACEAVGLDPQMGFLHADRPGRPSLALDLMEEFRPWLADRLALSLINRQQIDARGFVNCDNGSFTMNDATRKIVLQAWQQRKDDVIIHPFLNEKMTIGLIFFVQAQLLARWLRADLDGYPPMFWR